MRKKIVILGTGGTIAGAGSGDGSDDYVAGVLPLDKLLAFVSAGEDVVIELEEVGRIDSKDMSDGLLRLLALRTQYWLDKDDVEAVLITHGTDTLEESAYFLHAVIDASKPVILVSAMRPSTASSPDGPRNLADALRVAMYPGARGVMAVAAGSIHSGRDVRKVHPTRLDAFSSGDAGSIGVVEEDRLRMLRKWPVAEGDRLSGAIEHLGATHSPWPRVALLTSHAGLDAGLPILLARAGYAGIVVAGTGNATLHVCLEEGLSVASEMGVSVILTSRCTEGAARVRGRWTDPLLTPLGGPKARIGLQLRLLLAQRKSLELG